MAHRNAFILALCCTALLVRPGASSSPPIFPAIFAFGDSTVDPGNNNHIATLVRANHLPYGQAMPNQAASGRFSDGKLATDYISSAYGASDLLPAYLDPSLTDADLLGGASFGSAGTGLDKLTVDLSNTLDLATQIGYFDEALMRIKKLVGERKGDEIVNKGLFVISVGTNDMLYNLYLLPTRRIELSVSGYHDFLLQKLQNVIKELYKRGARKIVMVGVPPIGCLPLQVTVKSILPSEHMFERLCNQQNNNETQSYNNKIQTLTSKLQSTLKDAKIAYFDVYTPIIDMVTNPSTYGFEVVDRGCCGTGLMEIGPLCNLLSPICSNPSKFLFWDSIHPTQVAYSILANDYAKTLLPNLA